MLRIENQAIVFALLCKYTVETEGEKGREVIQKGMIRYGREYCVNVDKAVYEGFCEDFVCTPNVPTMSWGGTRCEFDWGQPLTEEDLEKMNRKKQALGTSAMRDFDYHTAHIYYTITDEIQKAFPESADEIIRKAVQDYVTLFGQAEYDRVLEFEGERF